MGKWKKVVAFVLAAAAMVWCVRANVVTRSTGEHGLPLVEGEVLSRQMRRVNGWPKDVLVRLNWTRTENGRVVADEQKRPKESVFNNNHLFVNTGVVAAIGYSVFSLLLFVFQRQISLRSLIVLMTCFALLAAVIGPYVHSQIQIRRANRTFEQMLQGSKLVIEMKRQS